MESSIKIEKLKHQPDENLFLYRYVTIDKLMDFLLNQRFPLTRLNLFEDKLEGITPQHLLLNLTSDKIAEQTANWISGIFDHITTNINSTERNSLRRQRIEFQKYNYASCWFVSDHESIAMWHLYSRPDSIAIKIPVKSFINEINSKKFELSEYNHEKIRYGKVQYYRFDDLESLNQLVIEDEIQGFAKDISFSHEAEFRIVLSVKKNEIKKAKRKSLILDEQVEDFNKKLDLKTIYLQLNQFKDLPFELIFHPQSSDWHKSNVRETIKKYEVQFPTIDSKLTRIFK